LCDTAHTVVDLIFSIYGVYIKNKTLVRFLTAYESFSLFDLKI
jgi:hypothetical protein